jgi:hypothetical protein
MKLDEEKPPKLDTIGIYFFGLSARASLNTLAKAYGSD